MTLKIDLVAAARMLLPPEEMVESHFEQCRGRRKCRNMPADPGMIAIGPDDHGHRVPSHQTSRSTFKFAIARERWLLIRRYCVHIWRVGGKWNLHAGSPRAFIESF